MIELALAFLASAATAALAGVWRLGRRIGDPTSVTELRAGLRWLSVGALVLSIGWLTVAGATLPTLLACGGSVGLLAGSWTALRTPDRRSGPPPAPPAAGSARARVLASGTIVALIVLVDLLFGELALASGAIPNAVAGRAGIPGVLLSSGFLAIAAAEILLFAVLSGGRIDRRLRILLAAPAGLLLLSPTMFSIRGWGFGSGVVGSALVIAMFVLLLQYIYRTKQLTAQVTRFLIGWTAVAVLVAAGWFLWAFERSPFVLCGAVVGLTVFTLTMTVVAPPTDVGERRPWILQPFTVFQLLLLVFLTEFFLGALLDLEIAGRGFLQYIPFATVTGSGAGVASALAYNGLWFAASILASAWFLTALGFTMGPLVLLKARETRERPQKYRLGLTVAVYALAAVYIPSFTSSTPILNIPALASLPVLGWGFGLRAGGPFEASVSLAVLLMYVGVGLMTVLFGRKALCAVMCGAALMYQGTAINEMRQFNQTSRVGKHFLGSQLSTAYVVMSGVALVSLFGISLLALLKILPGVQVANGEFDTAALPLPIELYFGGVWFVMFVSTPYIGTYNCATTGFCHWGALSIPFAKVGLFRLKVKDRAVCQACTTFDCAKACPVGLVDMPLHFRTTGEFRSTKCCGVGDCVGACPYGNLYHHDVRLWLRERFGRSRATPTPRGTPLPMVRSSSPTPNPPASPAASPLPGR